jgi:hypothetical protein
VQNNENPATSSKLRLEVLGPAYLRTLASIDPAMQVMLYKYKLLGVFKRSADGTREMWHAGDLFNVKLRVLSEVQGLGFGEQLQVVGCVQARCRWNQGDVACR